MMKIYILAGGKGERFWPLSRAKHPKQFLKLVHSGKSLLRATYERLVAVAGQEGTIAVITAREYLEGVKDHLSELFDEQILIEPVGKDTAPAVAYATMAAMREDAESVLAFFPADHYIDDLEAFKNDFFEAVRLAEAYPSLIVFGIKPTYPATGYGYIELGDQIGAGNYRVARFIEKPAREIAGQMMASGRYLWNSGILIARARVLFRELSTYLPEAMTLLREQGEGAYGDLPKISMDYAVLEKSSVVLVRSASFIWDDLGDWTALERLLKNDDNNVVMAKHIGIDTDGSILYTTGDDIIVTIGIQDVVIVRDGDVTLVCHKDRIQSLKEVLRKLKDSPTFQNYV